MSIYVKQFDPVIDGTFSQFMEITDSNNNVLVGGIGTAGLKIVVDADGNVLSQSEYAINNATVTFISVIDAQDRFNVGDMLLFGSKKVSAISGVQTRTLVIRVRPDGSVVWANTYGNATTIQPVKIIHSIATIDEERFVSFLFFTRNVTSASNEDIEAVRIDRFGDVLAANIIGATVNKDQALGVMEYDAGGALLYGASNAVANFDSFVIATDKNGSPLIKKLIGAPLYQEITALVPTGNAGEYVAAGDTGAKGGSKLTSIFKFNLNTSVTTTAKTMSLLPGADVGFKKLLKIGTDYYLFGNKLSGSLAAKFDQNLNLVWTKGLNLSPANYFISDAVYDATTNEIELCGWMKKSGQLFPLVFRTDLNFTTCVTITNANPTVSTQIYTITPWQTLITNPYSPTVNTENVILGQVPMPHHFICPTQTTTINVNGLIQSPYLYMQAAGSDQTDNSAKGIQLRWAFNKSLGDNHLAKGPYANTLSPYFTTNGFSKPNDYIKIYRAPYKKSYQAKVKFRNNQLPTQEIATGPTREWRYNNIALSSGGVGTTNVIVRFDDTAQYDSIRATMSPLKPENFMKAYTGIVEVEAQGKLSFSFEFAVKYNTGNQALAYLRTETVSLDDTSDATTTIISSRKTFTGTGPLTDPIVTQENVKYIRFDYSIAYVSDINLETYYDFVPSTNAQTAANTWQFLGDFSLTLDTALAFDRLENKNNPLIPTANKYSIDKIWDKYNDSSASTGEFKVKVDNYQHRWYPAPNAQHPTTNANDGIQKGIEKYLTLSVTDTQAIAAVPVENDPGNQAQINISYFDLLKLASIDYHIARMMGLGYIDADVATTTTSYVYLMFYTSQGPLQPNDPPKLVQDHIYLTLPTTELNYRKPPAPVQLPISYGISVSNGVGVTNQLTDANGYVAFDAVRFVDINRDVYDYEKPFGAFYNDPTEYSLADETIPVMYGLEYKGGAETVYRKPEITQDDEYFDYAGYNEVVEIPEQGQNPLYVHQEREEGIHCYAIYAVNWFSRSSGISNQECTDYTQFQKIKTLMPPSNFAVQLIQPEQPLMLTTQKEQTMLSAVATPDKTLVRATFEWNHNHNENYQFAERAQLFYRELSPSSIQGEVLSVTQLPNNQVKIQVKDYMILSSSPAQNIAPVIPPGEEVKYIGSLFSTGQVGFIISSINNSTVPYAEFTLDQVKQTSSSDPLNNNQMVTVVNWLKPNVGDKFLVVENLAVDTNWGTELQRMVYLEKFHTTPTLLIENAGNANNGTYRIEKVVQNGANTDITVLDKLKSTVIAGNIRYEKVFRLVAFNTGTNVLSINGNVTAEFSGVTSLRLFGSSFNNDTVYNITSVAFNTPNTDVTISGTIADAGANFGYIAIEKTANINGLNYLNKVISVPGNLTTEIIPPYIETTTQYDGTLTKFSYGGLYLPTTISVLPDQFTGLPIGAYTVKFDNSYTLPPHIDPLVEWHKGTIRVLDSNPNGALAVMKSLQVWDIKRDNAGNIVSPLEVTVFDPGFATDPYPIQIGGGVMVNFHPSYRIYLAAEFNGLGQNDSTHQFNAVTMMPATGDGGKITFMGIRSIDRVKVMPGNTIVQYDSYIATPVPVLAQEIIAPAAPKALAGPLFATRPDFYKKSSYTNDIKLDTTNNRKPFGVLVYRGSETKVLDTLYNETTLTNIILPAIEQLKVTDTAAYYTLINDLVNVNTDISGNFSPTPNSLNFNFPLPDNTDYIIPNRNSAVIVKPFLTATPILGPQVDIVRQAILDSFISLTEQPVIYKYVKGGITTSGRKPIIRNYNGDIIVPIVPEAPGYNADDYDPHPMAVKFAKDNTGAVLLPTDVNYSSASNDFYVRFTDYKLDGASLEYYFYYAREINNQLVIGPPSPVKAPVLMVNAAPAETPGIREVISILADPVNNINTAVEFKINIYNPTEGITQLWIYRAYTSAEASNIRTMKLAKKIDVGDPVIDDFSDLNIPPYGETLFYRIVAVRRIQNELSQNEDILSLPSNVALTNIVDIFNPAPPILKSENGTTTATNLQNVILKWKPTAYNGTYRLEKLDEDGNWTEIYRTKVKDTDMQYPPLDINNLPDFANYPETVVLPRVDADGNPVTHKFRVEVENSSGLLNMTQYELTLAQGCADLLQYDSFVKLTDGNGFTEDPLISGDINQGQRQPVTLTFTDITGALPAGHNTFTQIDVTVSDDLGNTFTKTINSQGGFVTFNQGEGGLQLDNTSPNRSYTIKTKLLTDYCTSGTIKSFTVNYVAGPCTDLEQLTDIVSLTDSTHTINVLASGNVDDGIAYPGSLTFTDISNPGSLGETFSSIDVTLTDNTGGSFTKTITSIGGSVTFNQGDGGLSLDSSNPNLIYTVKALLHTNVCVAGTSFTYEIRYTYRPCNILASLTNIADYTDGNNFTLAPLVNKTVVSFNHPNGLMQLQETVSNNLPPGHVFDKMEVTVEDDLGNFSIKTILSAGGNAQFNNGDGGLILDNSNPHRAYTISLKLFTNLCTDGTYFVYVLKY